MRLKSPFHTQNHSHSCGKILLASARSSSFASLPDKKGLLSGSSVSGLRDLLEVGTFGVLGEEPRGCFLGGTYYLQTLTKLSSVYLINS